MELFELQEDDRSSIGVGIRGLSGMEYNLLLNRLDTAEEDVSETEDGSRTTVHTPLSVSLVHRVPMFLSPVQLAVEVAGLPVLLFNIPETGLERVAGLCLSRLRRRAGEAWTMKVSKSAFCDTERVE